MEKLRDHQGTSEGIKPEVSDPPRRPGRPRHHADEAKRCPLAIRTTYSLRYALERASAASGRSLTQEIEYRLWQSFDGSEFLAPENHLGIVLDSALKDFEQRLLHLLTVARENMSDARRDLADDLGRDSLSDTPRNPHRAAGGQTRRAMHAEYGEPGEVARLLPVEIGVTRGDDGTVVLVTSRDGQVIKETPLDVDAAHALAAQLLAASSTGEEQEPVSTEPKRKSRRRAK
jgi:hypothetical protein